MKLVKTSKQNLLVRILALLLCLFINACSPKKQQTIKSFKILGINDVYRSEGLDKGTLGGLARVRTLRNQLIANNQQVLFLHAGDFLQPSFSSRINEGKAMIAIMNTLNGVNQEFDNDMVVTFGNHEFDKSKIKHMPRLQQRIDESQFTWLDSNINWLHSDDNGSIHSNKLKINL